MRLSDIFRGTSQTTDSRGKVTEETSAGQSIRNIARINRQIRSLVPGQTLQGEVVSKNGSEVQIKLADDMVLSARLEREIAIETGKIMTFEVKNNGSALSLSPLFANMSADVNVLKALEMANLPVNNRSVEMTELMMNQGMSVDKNSLQSVYRDVAAFQSTELSNIIGLHQMGMEVSQENLGQMEHYHALQHQLVSGMTDILQELSGEFLALSESGNLSDGLQLYTEICGLFGEAGLESMAGIEEHSGVAETALQEAGEMPVMSENEVVSKQGTAESASGLLLTELLSREEIHSLGQKLMQLNPDGKNGSLQGFLQQMDESSATAGQLLKLLGSFQKNPVANDAGQVIADQSSESRTVLKEIFGSREFAKLLKGEVLRQWLLEPETVADGQKVSEVYERLSRQLNGLRQTLSAAGGNDSGAMKAVTNMQNNLDFMNQMNQVYTYVQLPLQMSGRETHGELYVYTNKKNLAKKDGNVSALLHLDMEHLGPVDVYVAMQNHNVNTKFYLQDDEMIDFIYQHIRLLDERLKQRGYSMNCEITVREQEEQGKSVLDHLTEREKNMTVLSHYAFDVRA